MEYKEGCVNYKQTKVEEGGIQSERTEWAHAFGERKLNIFQTEGTPT